MDDAYTDEATQDTAENSRLTFQQVHEIVNGLDQKGVIKLDAPLRDVIEPVKQVLGGESDPSARLEIFIVDHYWVVGPNPH